MNSKYWISSSKEMSGLTRRVSREICEGLKIAWQLANAERPTERRGGGWPSIAEEGQPNSGSLAAAAPCE